MKKQMRVVFRGFLMLEDEEKSDLLDEIIDYYKKDPDGRRELIERYEPLTVVLGPLSNERCPCCGRKRYL